MIALVLLGTTGFSFAQDKNGSNPKMSPKARVARQHARIKNGVKNGTITKSQHKQLAQQGKAINSQRKADLAANGGKMPQSDRAQFGKRTKRPPRKKSKRTRLLISNQFSRKVCDKRGRN